VVDGVALELELPFEGSELVAYKLAGQGTFGAAFGNRFIHGTQGVAEYLIEDEVTKSDAAIHMVRGTRDGQTGMSQHGTPPMRGRNDLIFQGADHRATMVQW
jgi:hypothetical protein